MLYVSLTFISIILSVIPYEAQIQKTEDNERLQNRIYGIRKHRKGKKRNNKKIRNEIES